MINGGEPAAAPIESAALWCAVDWATGVRQGTDSAGQSPCAGDHGVSDSTDAVRREGLTSFRQTCGDQDSHAGSGRPTEPSDPNLTAVAGDVTNRRRTSLHRLTARQMPLRAQRVGLTGFRQGPVPETLLDR
ncbi:hypothetical protein Adu01nite_47550 [Paractinoplanes durhamensis]|uniref:Uncharacterized protein n=1 Tax=Paractinoplanes durhamensis TaxID=113563 RepID=A0ABQ3Z0P4_9ACTN|nr:hypothetical protein Adu01nite_47550 [Actinoplanes durhamensis]